MIVTMQASFEADHYEEAVAKGTAIWRDFIGDPDATLPWNASIRVELGATRSQLILRTARQSRPTLMARLT